MQTSALRRRRVFNRFESDPQTEGWTVLHSLGLARREAGPYGEIDFVVIIPWGRDRMPRGQRRQGDMRRRNLAHEGSEREGFRP